jgi:hypothetical protein
MREVDSIPRNTKEVSIGLALLMDNLPGLLFLLSPHWPSLGARNRSARDYFYICKWRSDLVISRRNGLGGLWVGVKTFTEFLRPIEDGVAKQLAQYPDEEAQFRDNPHHCPVAVLRSCVIQH